MNKKRFKRAIISIFLLCLPISCLNGCNKGNISEEMCVLVRAYGRHDVRQTVQFSGIVESRNEEIVTTESAAKIKKIRVAVGESIKKGEVICTFDTDEWNKKKKSIKKTLDREKAKYNIEVVKYQKKLENAKRKGNEEISYIRKTINEQKEIYDKYKKNFKKEEKKKDSASYEEKCLIAYERMMGAKEKYENSKIKYESTVLEQDEEEKSIEYDLKNYQLDNTYLTIKKEYNEICKLINEADIVANTSGIISEIYVEENLPSLNGTIAKIVDYNDKRITITGNERQFFSVQEGMNAFISLYGMEGKEYIGKVDKVSKLIEDSKFTAYVAIPQESELIVGMNVDVTIENMNLKNVYAVESSAVYENGEGFSCVLLAEKDNENQYVVVEKIVKIKEKSDEYMILESGELQEGDLVIQDIDMCSEGDIVCISESKSD